MKTLWIFTPNGWERHDNVEKDGIFINRDYWIEGDSGILHFQMQSLRPQEPAGSVLQPQQNLSQPGPRGNSQDPRRARGLKNGDRRRRQLAILFREQEGKCHWCKQPMLLDFTPIGKENRRPLRRATIDHLDDKFSPLRGTFVNARRRVAACWECNNKRDHQSRQTIMRDNPQLIWRKTGAQPLLFIDIWEGIMNRPRNKSQNLRSSI